MTNDLSHYFFEHGDQLLTLSTPVKLSVNEMYSITRRLKLPRDAQGAGGCGFMFVLSSNILSISTIIRTILYYLLTLLINVTY